MKRCLIIADDFTGSNDTGFQLKKRNIAADVVLFPERIETIEGSLVLDTESRNITEDESYRKVYDSAKAVFDKGEFDIVYKKVDSTLRGNIAKEISAVDEIYHPDRIVFAPSFPKIGRTTENGIHYLKGIRILETEMAKDPYNPVTEDRLSSILESSGFKTMHHGLSELRSLNSSISEGKCHTFDAKTEEDLDKIIEVCTKTDYRILWVGSAGLADSLFNSVLKPFPTVAIVGSISSVASEQIAYARNSGINIIKVPTKTLIEGKNLDSLIEKIDENLKFGKDIVITSCTERSDYDETVRYAVNLGLDKKKASSLVQECLGKLAGIITDNHEISGFFLTGGDTAISVINNLKASGNTIKGEVSTGVILSQLNGGKHSGLSVITKAGAFGEKDTIVRSLSALKEGL